MSAELGRVAQELVAPGKGILAADESSGTIKKRFDTIGVDASVEENRRAYRELLLTAPGMENSISGVILFDETTRQKTKDGVPFVEALTQKGVHPGVKTDGGLKDFGGYGEQTTKFPDDYEKTLKAYEASGLVFTKARSVYKVTDNTPTDELVRANSDFQTEQALASQHFGLMPIVEPEVLIDGDHSIEKCEEVSLKVLGSVFNELESRGVNLKGMLLKPSMVLPGKISTEQVSDEEIAHRTVGVLLKTVPKEVPGIVFLSGGQTPDEATRRLRLMNKIYRGKLPWELSFSYGRALQDEALKTWAGKPENVVAAQNAFLKWARADSLARYGR